METQKLLRMKEGVGENSYTNNSLIQKSVTIQAKAMLEESVKKVYHGLKPKCFMMADMGCSSGPNTLLVITEIINFVDEACRSLNHQAPEFGVFLNDLPRNDFNTLFNFLPDFYEWLEKEKGSNFGPCFVSGTPKSFHERVFPTQFLHFVYSGYALHWLSKVPEGLMTDDGLALNKGNICIAKTSPAEVQKAYYAQFKSDFTMFLRLRAKEVVPGGCMVLAFLGSIRNTDPHPLHELLGSTLCDMVLEGMVEEGKLDKFNIPLYGPSAEEVRQLVKVEGSFVISKLETFNVDWSVHSTHDMDTQAKFLTESIRAVFESLLSNAFGEAIIDDLFVRFKTRVQEHIAAGQPVEYVNLLVSLTKPVTA